VPYFWPLIYLDGPSLNSFIMRCYKLAKGDMGSFLNVTVAVIGLHANDHGVTPFHLATKAGAVGEISAISENLFRPIIVFSIPHAHLPI
jgi:hypothetical protein